MTKIAVVYYSTYSHVRIMAEAVKAALEASGCTADILQVGNCTPLFLHPAFFSVWDAYLFKFILGVT